MHKHFGKRTKKKHHIVLICSAVVIAAFVLRMPVEMNAADACGMQQKVNVLSSSMHNRQAEDYLNDAGEFCISQTVLREGKPSVVPQVRRIGLRFLPVSHMTQQMFFPLLLARMTYCSIFLYQDRNSNFLTEK